MAFLLGLLHCAGLAGGLQQLGLPKGETLQALALFNLGVEIGQLDFLALVLLVVELWRRCRLPTPLWLRRLPGYLVGSLGAYWANQRTVAMVRGPWVPQGCLKDDHEVLEAIATLPSASIPSMS